MNADSAGRSPSGSVRGAEHTLADFAAGLRVQRVVEHFHSAPHAPLA
ncbi:hypothetical protein [Actinoallomurus acanthiterrae]